MQITVQQSARIIASGDLRRIDTKSGKAQVCDGALCWWGVPIGLGIATVEDEIDQDLRDAGRRHLARRG